MKPLTQFKKILILPLLIALSLAVVAPATAVLPPGNTVAQWNKIAEDTVVGSGAFQPEGFIYMAYVSAAVYQATVAIDGGFEPYGPAITAPAGASTDAAIVEAAYRTLVTYFPAQAENLTALYTGALGLIPGGTAKQDGQAVGLAAATGMIGLAVTIAKNVSYTLRSSVDWRVRVPDSSSAPRSSCATRARKCGGFRGRPRTKSRTRRSLP